MNLIVYVIMRYFALLEKIQIILIWMICVNGLDRIDEVDYGL